MVFDCTLKTILAQYAFCRNLMFHLDDTLSSQHLGTFNKLELATPQQAMSPIE